MAPRLVGFVVFFATILALQVWGARQDRAAGVPFEVTAPADFNRIDRALAAATIETEVDKANDLAQGGAVFLRYGTDDVDKEYTEVVEVGEDEYPVRVGDPDRDAMFNRKAIEIGGQAVNVLDSSVQTFGSNAAIVAHLEAKVDDKPVRLTRYVVPTDSGRATVDGFCLVSEEAKYRPQFDAMMTSAKGVARRPAQLPWYVRSAIGAAVAVIAMGATRALRKPRRAAAA